MKRRKQWTSRAVAPRVHAAMREVVDHINAALAARGWTLAQLRRESGQTTTTVYGLLHYGRQIKPENLEAIGNALGLRLVRVDGHWHVE